MNFFTVFLIVFLATTHPVHAQDASRANDSIAKMKVDLNLQDDQVYHITPIIEKYAIAFQDLQKSIDDGTINPSAIDSQTQQIKAAEAQELSQYLRPDQISQWSYMQGQTGQEKDKDSDVHEDTDEYTNLPRQSGGG
jgi:hypothetical protein